MKVNKKKKVTKSPQSEVAVDEDNIVGKLEVPAVGHHEAEDKLQRGVSPATAIFAEKLDIDKPIAELTRSAKLKTRTTTPPTPTLPSRTSSSRLWTEVTVI